MFNDLPISSGNLDKIGLVLAIIAGILVFTVFRKDVEKYSKKN